MLSQMSSGLEVRLDLEQLPCPPAHIALTRELLRAGFSGRGHFVFRQPQQQPAAGDGGGGDEHVAAPVPKWAYTGEWEDGRRHGQGTLRATNGMSYFGQWRRNMYHGKGALSCTKLDS